MRLELRYTRNEKGDPEVRGLCLISESEFDSELIDEVAGKKVGNDGLIAVIDRVEVRLSDGYGEHYIYIPRQSVPKEMSTVAENKKGVQ